MRRPCAKRRWNLESRQRGITSGRAPNAELEKQEGYDRIPPEGRRPITRLLRDPTLCHAIVQLDAV